MSDSRILEFEPTDVPASETDSEAVLAPAETVTEADCIQPVDGPVCEKCGAAMGESQVSYCLTCGYYPSMGTYVEIDPWEKVVVGEAEEESQPVSHVEVWINLLPVWAWKLIGCHLVIVAVSVAVWLFSPAEGIFRTVWSVSQLFIGFLVFFACHLLAYLAAIEENADYSLLDIVLKPFKIWMPTIDKLPASLRQLAFGTCGLNAALMSVVVIGALPYHVLWDWGIKEPPKKDLVSAVVAHAMEAEGDEDGLEDAIGDFAGTAGDEAAAKRALEERRESVDCLIVGYTASRNDDQIASLILAREFQGKLVIIGRVAEGLEDETRRTFLVKLTEIARPTPFVGTTISANWVEPVYTCRVTGESRIRTGTMKDIRFDRMLGKIK